LQLSEKLVMYDEQAIALGHQRKDKHIFTYLFFIYTFVTTNWMTYYKIRNMSEGMVGIVSVLRYTVSTISGTYCVLITCLFLDLIRQRFRHLNETVIPYVSELPVTRSQGEITVYNVRHLHKVLLNSAELINALYGIGTLLTFLSILLELVWTTYAFIKNWQEIKYIQDLATPLNLLFQTIYLVAMYHFTTYEVKTDNFIVMSFENTFYLIVGLFNVFF
ncbi:PREDICTED: uncharacterized protein LOC105556778, partial [Vollenhovia emeryi]|uniref:uncharacterized protein LOC105556778 n=1 Tax=Vollenhovia emeryi TaxID=411798 RepID=UPI0005F40FFD